MKKFLYVLFSLVLILIIYSFIQDKRLANKTLENGVTLIGDKEVKINFVPKTSLYPAFGMAYQSEVRVREDLSPRIKRFVLAHELYHAGDYASWGGWIGKEIRANLIPALTDPLGFASTAFASLTPDRLMFYANRFIRGA